MEPGHDTQPVRAKVGTADGDVKIINATTGFALT
jgi:hypothetical protein